jgi:hypothetical protein
MELDVRTGGRAAAVVTAEPSDGDIARGLGVTGTPSWFSSTTAAAT